MGQPAANREAPFHAWQGVWQSSGGVDDVFVEVEGVEAAMGILITQGYLGRFRCLPCLMTQKLRLILIQPCFEFCMCPILVFVCDNDNNKKIALFIPFLC
ncbi:unnamed protein product [Brassica napus]|uniref:(rape) hypothetical protein n=1 Tax=Brassica napus TaxID=3708 RepID=A0A816NNU4_BRANA|nr:unnamed protein product [Brassica napus]